MGNGGEQWQDNIYFYGVQDQRSSIEWIREIAHEYSHMAFPIVGGDYTSPESWANGYIGERLLLRWIARGAAGGSSTLEKIWKSTFAGYANFDKKLIAPPLALFARNPLSSQWLSKRDANGMNYLIGMLLTVDDKAGAASCAELLWSLPQSAVVSPNLLLPRVRLLLSAKHSEK
jgi:hypothetical protein